MSGRKVIQFAPSTELTFKRNEITINFNESTAPSIEMIDNNRWKLL